MRAKYITTRDDDQGILEIMNRYKVKIGYVDNEEEDDIKEEKDIEEERIDKIEEEEEIEGDNSYPEWIDNGDETMENIWEMEE